MKSGIAPLILIVVIGIVLAVGGLGLGLAWKVGLIGKPGKGSTDGTAPNGTQPPPPQPPPSDGKNGEEDPTKDWLVYENQEQGYRIKYPNDWYIYPESLGGGPGASYTSTQISSVPIPGPSGGFSISVGLFSEYKDPEASLESYVQDMGGACLDPTICLEVDQIIPGVEFGSKSWVEIYTPSIKRRTLFISKDSMVHRFNFFELSLPEEVLGVIELIATTFEITK